MKLSNLMEGKFQNQGHIYHDLEERLYSRGIQPDCVLFYEEEKKESTQIEFSAPERATIINQDPAIAISTMLVVKWSEEVGWLGEN